MTMKKPPVGTGGGDELTCSEFYPRLTEPSQRSTSVISALLYRCSRDGWTGRSWMEAADQCDRWGDALGAFAMHREAKRALK